MSDKHFESLVKRQKVLGVVVGVNEFLVRAKGLNPIQINALVMFDDGSKGIVREINPEVVLILHLGTTPIRIGASVVMQHHELVAKVGKDFIGRVVNVSGQPIDGKGPIAPDDVRPVFNEAPPLIDRQELEDQLETGVTIVDTLFPMVLGQRLAILGDSKAGKSTFLTQLALNQNKSERVVIYALIAKRKTDVDALLAKLIETGAMANSIVVVSTMFDSLVTSYLAPYVACTLAEYIWQEENKDAIIIYDDLTSHAQVYREISLLSAVSPGRDSYPGDMFYAHSSLLERAGRIASSGKTLTSLPAVLVPGGDITTFLPTNIMSITDGQIIFDLELFRSGIRPAISTGLSVSRVGGKGLSLIHKKLGSAVRKKLASYYEAAEFSHFGTDLAPEAKADLAVGQRLVDIMGQGVEDIFSSRAQQIMLEVAISSDARAKLDLDKVKELALARADDFKDDDDDAFHKIVREVEKEATIEAAPVEENKNTEGPLAADGDSNSTNNQSSDGDQKHDDAQSDKKAKKKKVKT